MESSHFRTGFVFLVHIQENLEDELVKEALEKVGNNALGADFLWIQRYYAHKLPVTLKRGGGRGRCWEVAARGHFQNHDWFWGRFQIREYYLDR